MTGLLTLKWHPDDRVPHQRGGMNNLDPLLTAQQLAEYLQVPIATIYTWRHRHQGPPGFRVGKHLRFRWADVEDWIGINSTESSHQW